MWPVVAAMEQATVEVVVKFMTEKIIPPNGALATVFNDNAAFFTAQVSQTFKKEQKTKWKTVLAYPPMINEGRRGWWL